MFKVIASDIDGVTNKVSFLETTLSDLANAFQSGKDKGGILGAIASVENRLSKQITDQDIKNITDYNALIDQGVDRQSAWYRTMMTSSSAVEELAVDVKTGKISLDGVNATAKSSISIFRQLGGAILNAGAWPS